VHSPAGWNLRNFIAALLLRILLDSPSSAVADYHLRLHQPATPGFAVLVRNRISTVALHACRFEPENADAEKWKQEEKQVPAPHQRR
jgi:hypothetical protein